MAEKITEYAKSVFDQEIYVIKPSRIKKDSAYLEYRKKNNIACQISRLKRRQREEEMEYQIARLEFAVKCLEDALNKEKELNEKLTKDALQLEHISLDMKRITQHLNSLGAVKQTIDPLLSYEQWK